MEEQAHQVLFTPQVVSFDLRNSVNQLEVLSLIERVLHLHGSRLEICLAGNVELLNRLGHFPEVRLDL